MARLLRLCRRDRAVRKVRRASAPLHYSSLSCLTLNSDVVAARALYDYSPQSVDELALVAGEQLVLTSVGMDFGEGWAEVRSALCACSQLLERVVDALHAMQATKDGRTGIVPASYVGWF